MPTVNQLVRAGRAAKRAKSKVPALAGSPQKRGVCTRVYTTTPKKPTPGRPKAPKDASPTGFRGISTIAGRGPNLQDTPGGRIAAGRGKAFPAGANPTRAGPS